MSKKPLEPRYWVGPAMGAHTIYSKCTMASVAKKLNCWGQKKKKKKNKRTIHHFTCNNNAPVVFMFNIPLHEENKFNDQYKKEFEWIIFHFKFPQIFFLRGYFCYLRVSVSDFWVVVCV